MQINLLGIINSNLSTGKPNPCNASSSLKIVCKFGEQKKAAVILQ